MQNVLERLPKLETEHLILRKINKEDTHDIYHYGFNPKVSQRVSGKTHESKSDTEQAGVSLPNMRA